MKNKSMFTDVENVYSFSTEGENYQLESISFKTSNKMMNLLRRLHKIEKQNKIKMVMRGFSFRDQNNHFSCNEHEEFLENDLNKFFIVGQKSSQYLNSQLNEVKDLYNYNMQGRDKLIDEITSLYEEANRLIRRKNQKIDLRFLEITSDTSISQLQRKKFFLIVFLHNIGRIWEGKSSSPFLSFSYGKNKKETARKFATNSLGDGIPRNDGFIVLGYVPMEGKNFKYLTDDLNCELKELNVSWYENIHTEIMLLDGIMPHRIIGIFEVKANGKENFILNPWLKKMFSEGRNFRYKKGIKIEQNGFEEYAKSLKYGAYIFETQEERYNNFLDESSFHIIPSIEKRKE